MKYIKTKDGIITSDKATHELLEDVVDAGYHKKIEKGNYVRVGKEWMNFYGCWIDIIDENERHYSIRPRQINEVLKELPQADSIEELCDEFVLVNPLRFRKPKTGTELDKDFMDMFYFYTDIKDEIYAGIWTPSGLSYVAKLNREKGELELL